MSRKVVTFAATVKPVRLPAPKRKLAPANPPGTPYQGLVHIQDDRAFFDDFSIMFEYLEKGKGFVSICETAAGITDTKPRHGAAFPSSGKRPPPLKIIRENHSKRLVKESSQPVADYEVENRCSKLRYHCRHFDTSGLSDSVKSSLHGAIQWLREQQESQAKLVRSTLSLARVYESPTSLYLVYRKCRSCMQHSVKEVDSSTTSLIRTRDWIRSSRARTSEPARSDRSDRRSVPPLAQHLRSLERTLNCATYNESEAEDLSRWAPDMFWDVFVTSDASDETPDNATAAGCPFIVFPGSLGRSPVSLLSSSQMERALIVPLSSSPADVCTLETDIYTSDTATSATSSNRGSWELLVSPSLPPTPGNLDVEGFSLSPTKDSASSPIIKPLHPCRPRVTTRSHSLRKTT